MHGKSKTALFIDVANTESALQELERRVQYLDLRDLMSSDGPAREAICYVPINPWETFRRQGLIRFLKWNGFSVHAKVGMKRPYPKYKCDMDCEMAVDLLRAIWTGDVETLAVASGDVDLLPVYKVAKQRGIRVEMYSTAGHFTGGLWDVIDEFIDVGNYSESWPEWVQTGARTACTV